jgi:hypothetical protein
MSRLSETSIDYDRLMRANLLRVFGERDAERRLEAIRGLYAEDAVLNEPHASAKGHAAISDAVTGIGTADISFPGYDPADCVERVELIRVERSLGAFVREVPQPGSSLDEELNPSSDELPSSCPSIAAP